MKTGIFLSKTRAFCEGPSVLLNVNVTARGLARAREFTWERTAHQTLAVYQELE